MLPDLCAKQSETLMGKASINYSHTTTAVVDSISSLYTRLLMGKLPLTTIIHNTEKFH